MTGGRRSSANAAAAPAAPPAPWSEWLSGRRSWLVVADLDGPPGKYHVGDEAMFEANLIRLRLRIGRHLRVAAFSNAPEFTRDFYGLDEVCPPPRFAGGCRAALQPVAKGIGWAVPPQPRTAGPGRCMAAADGVLISGGGNLNSLYPICLKQRLAIALAARCRRVPVLMVGQGLGPICRRTDRWHLRLLALLCSAVGVRDRAMSRECLRQLRIPNRAVLVHLDDAFDLPPAEEAELAAAGPAPNRLWLAVSIHQREPESGEALASRWELLFAELLRQLPELGLCFLPHLVQAGSPDDDLAAARRVAERLGTRGDGDLFLPSGWVSARTVRAWTARCAAALTTRYHQAVFAAACGVPVVGLGLGRYGVAKLAGLFELLETADPVLTAGDDPQPVVAALVDALAGRASRPRPPGRFAHPLGPCRDG